MQYRSNYDERMVVLFGFIIRIIFLLMPLINYVTPYFQDTSNVSDFCYNVNSLVKTYDFAYGNISCNNIILYDDNDKEIAEIPIDNLEERDKIIYFYKKSNNVYFVISRSVDDESGIILVNDESDSILDGLWSIKRVGGNSYYYDTKP